MNKQFINKFFFTFLVVFLLAYMLLIFGPAEVFFANVVEFPFVYGEFAGFMALGAIGITSVLALIATFFPTKIYNIFITVIFWGSIGGYIQVMFLNKNLDLLGVNPKGYVLNNGHAIIDSAIWIILFIILILGALYKEKLWKNVVKFATIFLLCIQLVALVSLLITAKEEAYTYPKGNYHLLGDEQYTVSADKNVIVIILDYFSNQYLEPMLNKYPGSTEFLKDFTYYSNTDCNYYGTFPSLAHMLTGCEVDTSMSINEWCEQIWKDEKTVSFYQMLNENNYIMNVYTPEIRYLCGGNDGRILADSISNMGNNAQEINIDYELLISTMTRMSAFRLSPDIMKSLSYVALDEYTGIVSQKKAGVNHLNPDFYSGLKEEGLKKDSSSNYYIVQHLMGAHEYNTDANGNYKENATVEETTKGCMIIVEEYLEQLKKLGVYDDATIIITADHGDSYESQVIFFMKEAGESHDKSPVTNAPISLHEYLPTIAEAVGMDYKYYGQSVHDFAEDEQRKRTVWLRKCDENYPKVPCYTGKKEGEANVYYGYTYTGDIDDLIRQTEEGPSLIMEMVDSFW